MTKKQIWLPVLTVLLLGLGFWFLVKQPPTTVRDSANLAAVYGAELSKCDLSSGTVDPATWSQCEQTVRQFVKDTANLSDPKVISLRQQISAVLNQLSALEATTSGGLTK